VGFESEFILLKNTLPIEPVNQHGYGNSPALATGTKEYQILEEIAESLSLSGVELQMYHAEGAPGQYEVITGPLPPLQAADALIHTRETIYNIASKHGVRATFAPRVFVDSCSSLSPLTLSQKQKKLTGFNKNRRKCSTHPHLRAHPKYRTPTFRTREPQPSRSVVPRRGPRTSPIHRAPRAAYNSLIQANGRRGVVWRHICLLGYR
jgi:hypothetical protein